MLPRQNRLRDSRAFRVVYTRGRSWAHPLAVLHTSPQLPPEKRIGVTASRKFGPAVARNRIRRRLKAILRGFEPRIHTGVHLALVARQPAADASSFELAAAVESLLLRAGALSPAASENVEPEPYRFPHGDRTR